MPETLWIYCGDIHRLLDPHWVGIIVSLAAVLCGGLIGAERARAQKPAGIRTLILICLGSAIFTQASILIAAEHADRGRIAAQIVSGIGFLGAGAIIRERGLVIGVTTGAGIWATAAVGIVLGGGYVVAGIFFTLLIFGTLVAARGLDRLVLGPCKYRTLRIAFNAGNGKMPHVIEGILDEHLYQGPVEYSGPESERVVSLRICVAHREHRAFVRPLVSLPEATRVWED